MEWYLFTVVVPVEMMSIYEDVGYVCVKGWNVEKTDYEEEELYYWLF